MKINSLHSLIKFTSFVTIFISSLAFVSSIAITLAYFDSPKDLFNSYNPNFLSKYNYVSNLNLLTLKVEDEINIFPVAPHTENFDTTFDTTSDNESFNSDIAYSYLQEHFKDNDAVVFSNIIGEETVAGQKYYIARLFNKELYESIGSHGGNTLYISEDGTVLDSNQLFN